MADRTTFHVHPERSAPGEISAILAAGVVAHVGLVDVRGPVVYSRTALYHSVRYRSVVCFGRGAIASDDERTSVLQAMIARYYPGRAPGRDYDPMPNAHLEATVLIAMQIEDASAKVRRGGPKGPRDADPLASGTAGVLDFPRLELPIQR